MSTRAQHIRLGLFLVLFVTVLLGGLIALAGTQFWETRDIYTIRYDESVAGLEVGAPVKVNGVQVGRVDSIDLDEDNIQYVIVTVSLQHGIPLRRNAEAVVQLGGITGLRFIEVDPGTREASLMDPPGEIQAGESDLGVWTGRAEDIAGQFQMVLARVMRILNDENMAHVDTILEEMSRLMVRAAQLVGQLNEVVRDNRGEIGQAIREFRRAGAAATTAGEELALASRSAREDLHGALTAGRTAAVSVDELARTGTKAINNTNGLVTDARGVLTEERLGQVMTSLTAALQAMSQAARSLQTMLDRSETDLRGTLEAVRTAAEQLEDFSRTIRDNPGALLRRGGLPEEEVPR